MRKYTQITEKVRLTEENGFRIQIQHSRILVKVSLMKKKTLCV